mgnify:CR=1 FL=1
MKFDHCQNLTNQIIDELEGKVSKQTLKALTEAGKSAKNLDQLLSLLPQQNKDEILNVIKDSIEFLGVWIP